MKRVHLLTGNNDKIKVANHTFGAYGIKVLPFELDIPEIQAQSSVEIARYMVKRAFEMTGKPVIREDHSFFIKELGFPGPFMTYADKTISVDQLIKILDTLKSRDAYFELGAAYCNAQGVISEYSYRVPIIMSKEARGDSALRWERLMMFPGEDKTFAELSDDTRLGVWTKNYEAIAKIIQAER